MIVDAIKVHWHCLRAGLDAEKDHRPTRIMFWTGGPTGRAVSYWFCQCGYNRERFERAKREGR